MDHYTVKTSSLTGEITIPSSKSHTLRAILFGALGRGISIIHNYLPSSDAYAMIEACRLLGSTIEVTPHKIEIVGLNGVIQNCEDVIQAGNSGIVLRFCAAIAALAARPIVITGDHSIRHQRPMRPLLEGLVQLGVSAVSTRGDGYAPIIIQGPLAPGKTVVYGEDSQPISALLIAAAFAQGPTEIVVKNPGEKPWIDLTLDWFKRLGIVCQNHNYEHYRIQGNSRYEGFEYTVPGDFSSAAFPIAAAIVTGSELTVNNIDMGDSQGDKELIAILQQMGAIITIDVLGKKLVVKKGSTLKGLKIDLNRCIDAITILAVVACFAEGQTIIHNAAIAKQKECNRIQCIAAELRKMGASITATDDGLIIQKSALTGASVHSYHDHRMVMSLAVAGLGAQGMTTVGPTACVAKTFPTFVRDFAALGAHIREGV